MTVTRNGSIPFPINLTHVYVGLDNTRPKSVRVVCLDGDAASEPRPVWADQFKSMKSFHARIRPFLDGKVTIAAVSPEGGGQDPCGVVSWLEAEGPGVTWPDRWVSWEPFGGAGESYGLSPSFRRAFALARAAAYCEQAPRLVWDLFYETDRLDQELRHLLGRLALLIRVVPFPYGTTPQVARSLP